MSDGDARTTLSYSVPPGTWRVDFHYMEGAYGVAVFGCTFHQWWWGRALSKLRAWWRR